MTSDEHIKKIYGEDKTFCNLMTSALSNRQKVSALHQILASGLDQQNAEMKQLALDLVDEINAYSEDDIKSLRFDDRRDLIVVYRLLSLIGKDIFGGESFSPANSDHMDKMISTRGDNHRGLSNHVRRARLPALFKSLGYAEV